MPLCRQIMAAFPFKRTICSSVNAVSVVCVFTLFSLFLASVSAQDCEFPQYLQTPPDRGHSWTTQNPKGDSIVGYFRGKLFKYSKCTGSTACTTYMRTCIAKISEDTFQVMHKEDLKADRSYMCMRFHMRANHIIQISESNAYLSNKDLGNCLDSLMRLDPWLYILNNNHDIRKRTCPFSGGYNVRFTDYPDEPLCADEVIQARLESECEPGEGLKINFQKKKCISEHLHMNIEQSLFCAAYWTYRSYTFVILQTEQSIWCLRITGTKFTRITEGHLFIDPVCDAGDDYGNIRATTKYLKLTFEQRLISSICSDPFKFCDDTRLCNSSNLAYNVYCRKTCGFCKGDPNPCSFPGPFQGHWVEDTPVENGHVESFLNVTFYELVQSYDGKFQCHEKEGHDFENNTMLLQTFRNGCFPRFACMEMKKISSSVLEYRIGNRKNWPIQNWDNLKDQVCDPSMFRADDRDRDRYGNNIEEKPSHILVDSLHHFSVDCDLQYWLGVRRSWYAQETEGCDSCIIHDRHFDTHRIIMNTLNCSSPSYRRRNLDYRCMATFPHDDRTYAVVTRTLHTHQEYLCWVFQRDDISDEIPRKISIYAATYCNKVTIDAIVNGNFKIRPMHTMSIQSSCLSHLEVYPTTTTERVITTPYYNGEARGIITMPPNYVTDLSDSPSNGGVFSVINATRCSSIIFVFAFLLQACVLKQR